MAIKIQIFLAISFILATVEAEGGKETVCPSRFLKNVEVVYAKDAASKPGNVITEMSDCNPDLNAGFGGQYVYLVPEWTNKKEDALTGIQMNEQATKVEGLKDLAAGTRGKYRYLKMIKEASSDNKRINRVGLVRKVGSALPNPGSYGWDGCTLDINVNRKGDFLYLCWNSVKV